MKNILLVGFILLFFRGYSANKYVSAVGNDGNPGTQALPYRTVTKVNSIFSTLAPGDSVLFRRGDTFYGTITVNKSGTLSLPIVIGAYGTGNKPIITSLVTVPFVTSGVSNVYTSNVVSTLGSTVNIVLQGGTSLLPLGRYPNASAPDGGFLRFESRTTTSITDNELLNTPNWTGASLYIRNNEFTSNQRLISSHTGTILTVNTPWVGGNPIVTHGYFFNRSLQTLDSTGEWYYDPATKKIAIYSSTGTPTSIEATTLSSLLTSTNFSFITIDNLFFKGANDTAIVIRSGSGFEIKNCAVDFSETGIYTSAHNSFNFHDDSVSNSLGRAGVYINGTSNSFLRNNYIYKTQQIRGMAQDEGGYGNGMDVRGAITVEYNRIIKSGYCGIKYFSSNAKLRYNFIDSSMMIKNDGGAIYTVPFGTGTITGQEVIQNIILHSFGSTQGTGANPQGAGIYSDNNAENGMFIGNTVAYCAGGRFTGAIFLHRGSNNIIRGNTTFDNVQGLYFLEDNSSQPMRGNTVTSNLFIGKEATHTTFNANTSAVPDDIPQWGFFDSNYYARPLNDSLTCNTSMRRQNPLICFAQWRTAYPAHDIHSSKSLRYVKNTNQFAFYYNATQAASNVALTGTWADVRGATYSGTIVLQPYTSIVLLSVGSLTTPTITWANPAAITYGTALSGTQLNATANVAGTFAYNYASGTVLNGGSYTLTVVFTPTNGTLYTTATKSVPLTVNKAAATMTYGNLTQTYTGLPLAPTITTSPAGLTVINTLYNGVGQTPTNAATYSINSALTNTNYSAPPISGTFTISQAGATLTASNLAQTYNGSQKPITVVTSPVGLSGVGVTYNGSSTPPTAAGTYTVIVTLTNQNYTATQVNTVLVISKATPTVSWATPTAITYGTALSGTQLNASASVAGTFTYTPASGTILNAGTNTLSVNFTPSDATNYNSVNNTTVNLVVNKAVATISLNSLAQVYDGTQKVVTATTSPVGLNVVSITYDGGATPPTNAGSYTIGATLSNSNYTATPASGTLVISKAVATITLTGLTATYTGSAHAVTATTSPLGLSTVSITYNGSGTAPTNAGSYPIIASLSNSNYQATNATGTLVISKATPNVTWNNPAAITFGTALSGTQLNATANTAGTFTYLPPSGTILNAGTQNLQADFTPTDGTNWNSVTDITVTIVVNKAVATLSLLNLAQEYDGNPKTVSVITTPSGLGTVSVTYNGSGTPPTAAGTYAIVATLTNSNYTATPATGNLVISSPTAAVTITNLLQTYTGSPLNVTVTVTGGYPYDLTYNGSVTAPTNVGSYVAIATINDGIHVGADTATFVIIKANPSITWATPGGITYGTAINGTQLNASTATAGTFAYTPVSGTVLNAGTHILSTTFTPTDAANYNTAITTVSLVVNKAAATISLSNLAQVYDGTPKSAIATTSPAGLDEVAITYDGSSTPPSAVGSYTVVATLTNANYTATPAGGTLVISASTAGISISNILQTYTGSALPVTVTTNPSGLTYTVTYNGGAAPTNAGSYTVIATLTGGTYTGADTQTLVIAKATPVIVWANPADITFGTALTGTQLNASTSVSGTFAYSPASGTVLNVGTAQVLSTTFTPTSTANYNTVNKTVTINVTGTTATLTLTGLTQTYNGSPKPVVVTTSPVGLSGVTITYNGSATVPSDAGTYTINVSLVNSNYTATPVTGTLTIAKINPVLTWVTPAPIPEGTALTSVQLNATSNIAGSFTYAPTFGSVPLAGTNLIIATFHPTDSVNYNSTTISVALSVYGSPILNFFIRHGHIIYVESP